MGIFNNPPSGFQNEDFYNWIVQTISNANYETDALNKRITYNGNSVGNDEVQNSRTDLHGNTYEALPTRLDATQAIAERAISIANNKIDASQFNQTIAGIMSATPRDVLSSVSEMTSKYPNGTDSSGSFLIIVNSTDGYWYYWNGSAWTKGTEYQGATIGNTSIRKSMFAFDPLRLDSYAGNYVRIGNITWGAYRDYSSGEEVQKDGYFYVKMPVVAGNSLYILGTTEQTVFVNDSGTVIKGYVGAQYFSQNVIESPTVDQVFIGQVPTDATIVYVAFKVENFDKAYVGYQQAEPIGAAVLDNTSIVPESISSTKLQNPSVIDGKINLFDKTTVTSSEYVDYQSGNIIQKDGYSLSDWIPIDPRLKYKITNNTEQLAIYNGFKAYTMGVVSAVNFESTSLPTDARFIRLTIKNDTIDSVQMYPIYYFKKEWLSENVLVDKSGNGDFLTLKDALNGTHEGAVINLNNDIELTDEYTEAEINDNSFWGIPIADEKTINGNGHTIHCDLPESISNDRMQWVSTLMILGSCTLKDLTVSANRARYAMHIDYEGVDNFLAERVHFKIIGTTSNFPESMGGGLKSGQHHLFKDCTFETDWAGDYDIPASYHTFTGLTAPTSARFDNCVFVNKGKYNFRIGDLLNDMKFLNVFEFVQCRLKNIYAREERKDGSGLTFTLRGAGNSSELALDCSSQSGTSKPEIDFIENINVSTEGTRTDDH